MPKIVDHAKYKEELLEKCFEIFARRGYGGITLRQIASELGISPGSLYHYFPAKSNILEEMFSLYTKRDIEAIITNFDAADSLEKKIDKVFSYVAGKESYFQNVLLLTIDYFRHNWDEAHEKKLNQFMINYRDGIGAIIGLPEALSSMMILFLNGLVYNRMIFTDMVSFEEQCTAFRIMLVKYMRKRNDGD